MSQPPRVAIIDDSDVVLDMMEMVLEAEGWAVAKYDSAFGHDDALRAFEPTLILLDVNMRGLSEAGLGTRVSELKSATGAVVLLHSGRGELELRQLADRVGANGFLSKTGDIDLILRTITDALAR